MTQLGELSLWIALLMAAWCATLAVQGAYMRRDPLTSSGARGLFAALGFTALASAGLATAFLGDDYSLRYVAQHSSLNVETFYKLCAFWSGGAGELLLLSLLIAVVGSGAAFHSLRRDTDRARAAFTVGLLGFILAFALVATGFALNPFTPLARTLQDGRGLDPLLRHPLMLVQRPLTLLGIAGSAAPVAMTLAALMGPGFDRAHVARIRASVLLSWSVLSVALLVGVRWAYVSPGLRALLERSPAVLTGSALWTILTVYLIIAELREASRSPRTHVDVMRRRAALVLVGGGALLCIATFAARALTKNYDAQIGDGEKYSAKDSWGHEWTFTSQGASRLEREGDDVIAVALMPTRDGARQPFITSESRQYYGPGGLDIYPPQTVPGIRGTIAQDLFVVLADAGDGRAVLRISFRPLVELVWAGSVLLALGGLLLFWPPRERFAA